MHIKSDVENFNNLYLFQYIIVHLNLRKEKKYEFTALVVSQVQVHIFISSPLN